VLILGNRRVFGEAMETPKRVALAALIVAYLALALGYSLADPLYESTDELRHVRYVRHIATYGNLPVQRSGAPRAQSHHPPLYYALGALVSGWVPVEQDVYYQPTENPFWAYRYWEVSNDNKNQYIHGPDEDFPFQGIVLVVYLLRWMTVLIGAGVVWLTYQIGLEVFHHQPALALGAAALVAFNPQFLYLSGAVSNDTPAALCGAAVLLVCVRVVRQGPSLRRDVMLGILMGLSFLTKLHLVALLAPVAVAYLLAAWPSRDWRAALRAALVIFGLAALLSGWWFLRNWRLYGDPTGMSMLNQLWAGRSAEGNWWVIGQKWPYLWSSLWGRFGYGQVPLPQPIYRALFFLCAVSLAGYLLAPTTIAFRALAASVTGRPDGTPSRIGQRTGVGIQQAVGAGTPAIGLLPLLVDTVVFTAAVAYYTLIQPAGAMGRFLFPALPALAVLLIGGLSRLLPRRLKWIMWGAVTFAIASLAIYALVAVLVPAFAPPQPLKPHETESIPHPLNSESGIVFEDKARLLGYQITPQQVDPEGTLEVTLYWEALSRTDQNLVVFVHVLSDAGTMIAQRDTYPGLGRYPTTVWDPGVVFADTYRVHIPAAAYAPDQGYVQVGLYYPEGPRLKTDDGRDAVRLTRISVRPRAGDVPNPMNVNFGDKIALIGYALDERVARPGGTIRLTLYWRALNPMTVNYKLFVHVLGEDSQIWANSDSPLTDRAVCTNRWEPGTMVKEVRELKIVEATPPDFYDIELGLHASGKGRLHILAEDGRQVSSRLILTRIRILDHE
jgi:4-amino-4-deoxy-L-arabinose transferase-like glycosyltransferase